ncbi:MAG: extracellular solute-binding protein [Eubacteriales bacterium]|nr:extracellular solute-binding protein [Eubacteriales bacterium]
MRYIKRTTAVFLVFAMVITCSGCSFGKPGQAAKNLKVDKETTITVWYNDENYKKYLELAALEFHSANELVTINPVYISSEDYLEAIYNESVRNGNAPDVFLMSSDYVEKAYLMGLMLENDSFEDIKIDKAYGKAAVTACSYKNKLYGYPVTFNAAFMVYNTKYTSAVDTFTQLTEYSNNYKVTEENAEIEMVTTWDVSSMFLNYPFAGSYIVHGGSDSEEARGVTLDDGNIKLAMSEFAKLKEAYGIDRMAVDQNQCVEMFAAGRLLYTIIDANHLSVIDQSDVEYDVCKIPALTDSLKSQTMSTTTMAVVNPYSSQTTAAKAAARALSYDYAIEIEETSGYMCARGDYKKSKNKAANENLHKLYDESVVKAKYTGIGDLYMRYEIMLHQIWDGADVETSYNVFKANVESLK